MAILRHSLFMWPLRRNVRLVRRMLPPGESQWVRRWDRQIYRQTDARPLHYRFLLDLASTISSSIGVFKRVTSETKNNSTDNKSAWVHQSVSVFRVSENATESARRMAVKTRFNRWQIGEVGRWVWTRILWVSIKRLVTEKIGSRWSKIGINL